jgi:parallel beta-helix repeat protein
MITTRLSLRSQFIFSLMLLSCFVCSAGWAMDYYVDAAKGQDTNSGTLSSPLKTVSAGAKKAIGGDTVWVASGTYRETINLARSGLDAEHPITIRAMEGANVQIKGSDIVSGWAVHSGYIWKRAGWNINTQQVFVDGFALQQIGTNCPFNSISYDGKPLLPFIGTGLSDMIPGSFFYDQAAQILYIWLSDDSSPGLHQTEASVRDFIIPPSNFKYIELHNLKFCHSNQTSKQLSLGLVNVWGSSWKVSGCSFLFGDFSGIHVVGEKHQFFNNIFNNNGAVGITINGSDSAHNWKSYPERPPQEIHFQQNETNGNNYRNFYFHWHAGGIKAVTSCNTVTFTQHKAKSNYGHGIWFDGLCKNVTINRCLSSNNSGAGIFYEISDKALIVNSLVSGNSQQGIYVSASDEVLVTNNNIVGNWAGVVLHGMPRSEHLSLRKNRVRNNIISNNILVDFVLYSNSTTTGDNYSNHNIYYNSDGKLRISLTTNSGYAVNFTSLSSFALSTGNELNSSFSNPLWADPGSGNYLLPANSPAVDSGVNPAEPIGNEDFQGSPRIVDGSDKGIAIIDIGGLECQRKLDRPSPPQDLRIE